MPKLNSRIMRFLHKRKKLKQQERNQIIQLSKPKAENHKLIIKILMLGEADFSFSRALLTKHLKNGIIFRNMIMIYATEFRRKRQLLCNIEIFKKMSKKY